LQFGAQGDLLAMLLGDAGRDYGRSVKQSRRGARVIEAGIDAGRESLNRNLAISGLSADALPETADARRIQQTQAAALGELDLRGLQAREGAASGVRQAGESYREDAGKIRSQLTRLISDRGTYTAGLLDELIEGDRNARRTARAEAREQAFDAEQKALDRDTRLTTSLIGQGIGPDGSIIPGGKADPKTKKPRLTPGQQLTATGNVSQAIAQAKRLRTEGRTPQEALEILTSGRDKVTRTVFKDAQGRRVPEYVQQTDARGNPKRVKNPAIATEDTLSVPKVPTFQELYARAAVEAQYNNGGRLSAETVKALRRAGIRVKDLPVRLPGAKPKPTRIRRPGHAPGPSGQQRPG
jgi:hypothetical protein